MAFKVSVARRAVIQSTDALTVTQAHHAVAEIQFHLRMPPLKGRHIRAKTMSIEGRLTSNVPHGSLCGRSASAAEPVKRGKTSHQMPTPPCGQNDKTTARPSGPLTRCTALLTAKADPTSFRRAKGLQGASTVHDAARQKCPKLLCHVRCLLAPTATKMSALRSRGWRCTTVNYHWPIFWLGAVRLHHDTCGGWGPHRRWRCNLSPLMRLERSPPRSR